MASLAEVSLKPEELRLLVVVNPILVAATRLYRPTA
jgi:hypothetical protein